MFVGACPRSGTTLLRTVLNSHPELAMPRETRFLVETWLRRARFDDLEEEANRRRLAEWIFGRGESRARRLRAGQAKGVTRLTGAPPTVGSLVGTCFQLYAEAYGKPRWGDKRPMLCQYLDAVFGMFPDAQFVNVVRDPRATAASIRKVGWYDGDIAPATELWVRSLHAVDRWRGRLGSDQLVEVAYEDLVTRPEATMRRLADSLGLDGAGVDDMLSHPEGTDIPNSRIHWQVARPVSTTSLRTWHDTLTASEIAFIERVTGADMRRYGYEPVSPDARVPPALMRTFHRRRRRQTIKRWRRSAHDVWLRMTYGRPVAARLTTGQRTALATVTRR